MFVWDARKATRNLEKHGVSFEEAATVFSDPQALEWEDLEHSHMELRFKRLGLSSRGRILILVYSYRRLKHGQETFRIITARRASPKEGRAYAG
ncbi:MAG TPA: BrnT family toxin [Verrucomicrobiae bacterium]|nr:BrnT family toxin [Verrucomicrobiae bacterium]